MKWIQVSSCALLLGAQLGCGAGEEQSLSAGGATEAPALGAHGSKVLEAREYLTRFGYFPNTELQTAYPAWRPVLPETKADFALFDEGLEKALQKYQRNQELEPSGLLDAATLEAMSTPRCGFPDTDPDAARQVDKWALIGPANRWNKTTIKYRINQPNTVLPGMGTKEATKLGVLQGFALWVSSTNLAFIEVTSGEDLVVDYKNLGPDVGAQGGPPPTPFLDINTASTFNPTSLRATVGHEVGHVIGLHHSSNFVAGVTSKPLMAASGNSSGILMTDDRIAPNVLYNTWERLPGLAVDIGVGGGGTAWIIGTGARVPHRWDGANWIEMSFGKPCKRIDVDSQGKAWVTTDDNVIYRFNGGGWSRVSGGLAVDVGIGGPNDTTYVIGTDANLYVYANSVFTFQAGPPGGSIAVDVDMAGIPHVVASNNDMWVCGNPSCVRDGDGARGTDVSYGGPSFYTFGTENWGWHTGPTGDETIWARSRQVAIPSADPRSATPATDTWIQATGSARRISVGPQGRPWVVTSGGEIYRRLEL